MRGEAIMTGFRACWKRWSVRFRDDVQGTTAIEYALIASGVGMAILTTVFGLGSQLHDHLIQSQSHRTAVLSVMHRSQRARQLYTSRGWETLVKDLRFSTEPGTPFSLLGLRRPSHRLSILEQEG